MHRVCCPRGSWKGISSFLSQSFEAEPLAESLRVLWEGVSSSIKQAGFPPGLDSALTALSGSLLPVSSSA